MKLSWYRLKAIYKNIEKREILHSTLQAIVKHSFLEEFPEVQWKNRTVPQIFYHVPEKKFDVILEKNESFEVHYFFCSMEPEIIERFRSSLQKRMAVLENQKYYELIQIFEIEERTPELLRKELPEIPENGEIELDFLMPLPFKPKKDYANSFFDAEMLIRSLKNRLLRLLNYQADDFEFEFTVDSSNFIYTELCTHQVNGTRGQKIHGCTGKLLLKGCFEKIKDLLLLCHELHAGAELSSSQGYFRLTDKSKPVEIKEKDDPDFSYRKPLYISTSHTFLSLDHETVQIVKDKSVMQTYPLNRISELIVLEKSVFSTELLKKCSEKEIKVSISLGQSNSSSIFIPENKAWYETIAKHRAKYESLASEDFLEIAKNIAISKISGYKTLFKERYKAGTSLILEKLEMECENIIKSESTDEIRGHEGFATRIIYDNIKTMIKEEDFKFIKREKEMPDRINSLLNFGYALLFIRINLIVKSLGLDPYIGFLHSPENRYESLTCDIQEPFRARIVRAIIRVVNLKIIQKDDFIEKKGALYLKYEPKIKFLNNIEKELQRTNTKNEKTLLEEIYEQCTSIKKWARENSKISWYKWE